LWPIILALMLLDIVSSIDPSISTATFYSACKEVIVEIKGVSFVVDTSLGVTSDYEQDSTISLAENGARETEHLIRCLQALGQHWERLLFSTGGAINFQKSHWYLMAWLWKQGILRLATTQQAPGTLAVTAGREVTKELVPEYLPPRPSKHWECIFHHQDLNSSKQTC
jgi:hypothetical protein